MHSTQARPTETRARPHNRWKGRALLIFLAPLALVAICACAQQQPTAPEKPATSAPASEKPAEPKHDANVRTQMHNVKFRFTENVAVNIKTLSGALVPTPGHELPVIDDKNSFLIHIDSADTTIDPVDMANVFNSYVLRRPNAPLSAISMTIEKGQLKVKGRLRDKGNIPFETIGTLSATSDGRVRLHSDKVKALHVPVKGLMDAFGIEVDDLIKNRKIPGVQSEENDLILDLQQILPPPHLQGAVSSIRIEGNSIAATFGKPSSAAKPASNLPNGNFMMFQGNRMRFGKLLMDDTDIILSDLDRADPLDFFIDRYTQQMAAGYIKISTAFQLRVFLKDYAKLPASPSSSPR
jgi:hypothetical protein